jgi:alkylated DNA repair dioxygenase AlkB|tara:strand:- start:31 stop:975 length:945 start_codon:yes stop_codon:yes gene_type:complete
VTSVRNPDDDYAKTPMRVSMSCCPGSHEVGIVNNEYRYLIDGEKESSSSADVETTLGFKYTYSPLSESHVVSRCMPARIRICLEELTRLLRTHGVLHHDVNACQLLTYDVRNGVSIGFHHDGSPSSSQAENSQLLGTSVLSITLGSPMNLVFAIQHKDNINGMDEILSVLLSHGTVLSMGPITDIMYKHSARGLSSKSEHMKKDKHHGMRHVFVCRALTIVKRFYGQGWGHPNFPYQLVPTQAVQEHQAALIRDRLSKHRYPVRIKYLGGQYTGYAIGTTLEGYLEVWVPDDNSCVEVRSFTGVEFLKQKYPGF